jgi:hypothetical protein
VNAVCFVRKASLILTPIIDGVTFSSVFSLLPHFFSHRQNIIYSWRNILQASSIKLPFPPFNSKAWQAGNDI